MRKKIFIFVLAFGILPYLHAQQAVVSDSAKVSLITCSPGPKAYEKFGHSAIRYQDPASHTDVVFNYGIFNFDKPNFYLKFVEGETYYTLGVYETKFFLPEYKARNSQVTEQTLNFTQEEKQRLVEALFTNYLPENREYLYNFVFDNCATRPRDMILSVLRDKKIQYPRSSETKTFREWVTAYTGEKSWLQFGIDLTFGRYADRNASQWETMFLPEALSEEFGSIQIIENDSVSRALIGQRITLTAKTNTVEKKQEWFVQPLVITSLLLLLIVLFTLLEYRKKKHFRIIDTVLLFTTGLAGVVIFFLMFFSIHPLVKMNFNILWCNPLNVFVAFFILFRKMNEVTKFFQALNVVLFITALIIAALSVQILNVAFIPVIALLLIRTLYWFVAKNRFL